MSRPPLIADLALDDENVDKMWVHGISPEQVVEMVYNKPRVAVNRKGQRGDYLVVGRDNEGACIAMPIERTSEETTWRPVTAWYCKQSEEARLR